MLSRASSFKLTKPKSRRAPYNLDIPKNRTGFQTGLTVKKLKITTIRQESNELSKCIFRENVTLIFVILCIVVRNYLQFYIFNYDSYSENFI